MAIDGEVLYEYPFSERIRTLLRLEDLFDKLFYFCGQQHAYCHQTALLTMFEILEVTSRADLKSDLLQELERHKQTLQALRNNPQVSESALAGVLGDIDRAQQGLNATTGKAGQHLRDNEWLMSIRSRSIIPGGTCEFDLPDFFFWLNQATDARARSFNEWLATLRPLCDAIAELLWITRQHGKPRQEIARGGVYHITFERDTPIQLVRIALPASSGLYPETSGSHYRCSVRLLAWNGLQTRPVQTTEDVPFTLTCCT
jgi:cell division protein ZapD